MQYILLHIPSRTIPKEVYKLIEGVMCFHSNKINEDIGMYSQSIGLVVDIELNTNYERIISDFIVTLNLFQQEHKSVHLLSTLDYKKNLIISEKEIITFIEPFLNKNSSNFLDFNELTPNIISQKFNYSFIEIFEKLSKEDSESFVYGSLKYLSIINVIIMTTNRIYDNVLFENALLFQLFEAILLNHEKKYKDKAEFCEKCKKSKSIGLSARIERFFNDIKLNDQTILETLKVLAKSRHSFFHALSGLPQMDHIQKVIKKIVSNYISYENELKHANGTYIGKEILKELIIEYLLNMLLIENNNNLKNNYEKRKSI